MVDSLVESIVSVLGGKVSSDVIAFLVSVFPVLELRGGLFAAKLMDIDFFRAFIICYLGNMLPIPFILFFIRKIFNLLKKIGKVENAIENLEARSIRKERPNAMPYAPENGERITGFGGRTSLMP